ncbi:MAG: energy-coupling factor transporter transmembrane component T [Candidatus Anstonellales archaeon]
MLIHYVEGASIVHSLAPELKMSFLLLFLFLALIIPLEYSWILLLVLFGSYYLANISLIDVCKKNWLILAVGLIPLLGRALFQRGELELFMGVNIPLGLYLGIMNFMYVVFISFFSLLFVYTTKPHQLQKALLFLRVPKKIVLMFIIALHYIPYFQRRIERIRIAHEIRGGKDVFSLLIPLISNVFLEARKLSIALEIRGFESESD